jgi:hypothetical protein
LWGDTAPHDGHCVSGQRSPQPGQTPAVQNVCHSVAQRGRHAQRSSGRGR